MIKKGKEITIEDIEKELKVNKEDIVIALESTSAIESLEESCNKDTDGNKIALLDKISTGNNEEEQITNKIVVKQLINQLDTRDKEIIMLRFFKEKTQTEVAKILGISQVQVSRIEKKVLNNMKMKLIS